MRSVAVAVVPLPPRSGVIPDRSASVWTTLFSTACAAAEHAIPESHAESLRVRLRHRRQQPFAVAPPREIERESNHALRAVAREHRGLHRDLVRPAGIQNPADLRVLTFRVLAYDDEVDLAARLARERTSHAGVQHGGPDARVLIEPATDRQEEAVERDVVLEPWIADGAEHDRGERP